MFDVQLTREERDELSRATESVDDRTRRLAWIITKILAALDAADEYELEQNERRG